MHKTVIHSVENLYDPDGSYLSCEKNVKRYLREISDSQIKTFYENLEYTPFPILLIKEYKRRFRLEKQK